MERQRGRVRRQRDAFDLLELSRIEHRNRPLARIGQQQQVAAVRRARAVDAVRIAARLHAAAAGHRVGVDLDQRIVAAIRDEQRAFVARQRIAFGARAGHHRARRDRRVARMELRDRIRQQMHAVRAARIARERDEVRLHAAGRHGQVRHGLSGRLVEHEQHVVRLAHRVQPAVAVARHPVRPVVRPQVEHARMRAFDEIDLGDPVIAVMAARPRGLDPEDADVSKTLVHVDGELVREVRQHDVLERGLGVEVVEAEGVRAFLHQQQDVVHGGVSVNSSASLRIRVSGVSPRSVSAASARAGRPPRA